MVTLTNRESGVNYLSFTFPFKPSVWLAILVTMMFSGFTYLLLSKLEPNTSEAQGVQNSSLSSFWVAVMAFTGNIEIEAVAFGTTFLSLSLAFWSLLITAACTANLASFILIKNSSFPVNSMEEAVQKSTYLCNKIY